MLRLSDTGALDASFGTNGVVTTRFTPTGSNIFRRLVLQPDGKIVLVGGVPVGASNQCGIARFDANGALDPGFGTGGKVLATIESCTIASLQPDGKLVVVGGDSSTGVWYAKFARLLRTGAPDNGFGTAGYLGISSFDVPPARVSFTSSGNLVTMLKVQDPTDGSVQKSYVVELSGTLTGPWVAQSITLGTLPPKNFGDADFALPAAASSGLPVSYGRQRRLHGDRQHGPPDRLRNLHDHGQPGGDATGSRPRRSHRASRSELHRPWRRSCAPCRTRQWRTA